MIPNGTIQNLWSSFSGKPKIRKFKMQKHMLGENIKTWEKIEMSHLIKVNLSAKPVEKSMHHYTKKKSLCFSLWGGDK